MAAAHDHRLTVRADPEALARAVAEAFVHEAAAAGPRFVVALSGGTTPRRAYELLAGELRGEVDWRKVVALLADDRCVPQGHPASNEGMLRALLFDHVPARLHGPRCAGDAEADARAYEATVRTVLGDDTLHLAWLGMGADGHTASLLPGSAAAREERAFCAAAKRPEEPFSRVTLTAPVLSAARRRIVHVQGADKARTLREVLSGQGSHPVSRVRAPEFFVDAAAAAGG